MKYLIALLFLSACSVWFPTREAVIVTEPVAQERVHVTYPKKTEAPRKPVPIAEAKPAPKPPPCKVDDDADPKAKILQKMDCVLEGKVAPKPVK